MLTAPDFKQKQIIFAMLSHGERLSFKNDNVIIKDAEGVIKHQSTCYRLFALLIVGHISITSGLLQRAEKFGFTIVLMTHSLRVYGLWSCGAEGNVLLRKKQYDYGDLSLAKQIVRNKIYNQLAGLKRVRNKTDELKQGISELENYLSKVEVGEDLCLQELLGIEGSAGRSYFKNMFCGYDWCGRRPRVKHDMTNCLMDIGYTLLFNIVEALLKVYGFDLYRGVYHQEFYQRKSLVCDLVEPFRPLVDWQIRKAYNLGQIKKADFTVSQKRYCLFGKSASAYIVNLLEPLIENKQSIFMYIQGYYRSFMKGREAIEFPFYDMGVGKCL